MPLYFPKKIYDTERIPSGGRVDAHWYKTKLNQVFGKARKGPSVPRSLKPWDPDNVLEHFNMRAFEFGNWLNQEDRYEYLIGTAISLHDLASILGLDRRQIGLGSKLSIAFGARGKGGGALAHFEPSTFAINLTRYKNEDKGSGDSKYLLSGGTGSLGHEWFHALDMYLSVELDQEFSQYMLSDITSECLKKIEPGVVGLEKRPKGKAAQLILDVMIAICYDRGGKEEIFSESKFYRELREMVEDTKSSYGPYWIRMHEIFARSMEVYIFYEGQRQGIHNPLLKKTKYTGVVYPTKRDYDRFRVPVKKLLSFASNKIRKTIDVKQLELFE